MSIVTYTCKRGTVVELRRECIGCHGFDHRGNLRKDADSYRQMEYVLYDGERWEFLGYCCTKGCVKKAGGYVKWQNEF